MTLAPTLLPDQRYDWWRVLEDLRVAGMHLEEVSAAAHIPRSTLAGYKNLDVEPKHADGVRLLDLWRDRMPREASPPITGGSVRIDRRVQSEEMALQQRCGTCGQVLRGIVLDKWNQLRLHYDEHGGPAPS